MISTSPIKISCVIRSESVTEAVQALHEAFELEPEPTSSANARSDRRPR